MDKWYPLDNAGIFYPSIISKRLTTVFRLSVTLDHPVKVRNLQLALDKTLKDFPQLQVHCRPGFFWYYFEENKRHLLLTRESKYPCQLIPIKKRNVHPIQVRVFHKRISLELSHALTDGTGALFYLKNLIIRYFIEIGYNLELPPRDSYQEEMEDSYKKYFKPKLPPPRKSDKAFHMPWKPEPSGVYFFTTGTCSTSSIAKKSKEYGVSITEYLLAVLGVAVQRVFLSLDPKKRRKLSKPIRLMVPINLRKMFPSKTLRNFFLSIEPSFDPELGNFSFEEVLNIIHHFVRVEVNDKYVSRQISRNIKGQIESKLLPLFIKNLALKSLYKQFGESRYTTSISNMGIVTFPSEIENNIERVDFIPPPSPICKTKVGVISYKECFTITFGSIMERNDLEKEFFRILVTHGIPVEITSNRS